MNFQKWMSSITDQKVLILATTDNNSNSYYYTILIYFDHNTIWNAIIVIIVVIIIYLIYFIIFDGKYSLLLFYGDSFFIHQWNSMTKICSYRAGPDFNQGPPTCNNNKDFMGILTGTILFQWVIIFAF